MTRAARLLDLLQALRGRRRPVTAAALAAETGVSLRTIYRDIAILQGQGAPIEGAAGLGYVLQAGYLLPPLMFGEDEIDALVLGLRFVSQRGDPALGKAAGDALAKIIAILPPAMEDVAATSSLLAPPVTASRSPHLAAIRAAIRAERTLRLDYADKQGRRTLRVVWPIAVGFFDAVEMLSAWCESRADFRHFRLDRIAGLEPTGERFPKRHRLLLAEWRLSQGIEPMV